MKSEFSKRVALVCCVLLTSLSADAQTSGPVRLHIPVAIKTPVDSTAPAAATDGKRPSPVRISVNPSAASQVHADLKIYNYAPPLSGGEAGGFVTGGLQLSTVGDVFKTGNSVQLGWNATFPALVKKGRWEVAGIMLAGQAPQWGAGAYPPPAGSGEVNFAPQTNGWSLFTVDFAPIFAAKNFTWLKADSFIVRLTPLHADGSVAGPASGYVILKNSTPGGLSSGKTPPPKPPSTKPVISADHFTPDANLALGNGENTTTENGPELHMKVTRAPAGLVEQQIAKFYGVAKPGDTFVIGLAPPSQDTTGFDAVMNFVGDAVQLVGKAIDFTSGEFAALKGDLVSVVAKVVQNDTLANVLVDVAMSYCGIPPTLPDSEAMQNMGADYIMDYTAEQAGVEVPDAVKDQVKGSFKQMNQKVKAAANGQFAATFYAPDPAYLYHPPVLYLRATYPGVTTYSHQISVKNTTLTTSGGTGKTTYSDPIDTTKDKFKDTTIHGDDTLPGGIQYPGGKPPKPPLPQGNGQNVNEPQTGSTGGGGGAPVKSEKYDFDLSVSADLDWKTLQNGQFGIADKVAKPVIFVAHVHVPPLRAGESIIIPVILHFGPMATSADFFERKSWYTGWGYNVKANYNFNIAGSVSPHPIHNVWSVATPGPAN